MVPRPPPKGLPRRRKHRHEERSFRRHQSGRSKGETTIGSLTYLCGPPGSGKTTALRQRYLQAIGDAGEDSVLWLTPDAASRAELLADLLRELPGPRRLAHHHLPRPRAPAGASRPDIRRGHERPPAAPADAEGCGGGAVPESLLTSRGFLPALAVFLDELKRAAVYPEHFESAVHRLFPRDRRARNLADFYTRYQNRLNALGLYDEAGLFWGGPVAAG